MTRRRATHEPGYVLHSYPYKETSLIEDGAGASTSKNSNRLGRTILQPGSAQPISEPYSYDAHGSMTTMPHLPLMQWDFKDQLSATSKQIANTTTMRGMCSQRTPAFHCGSA